MRGVLGIVLLSAVACSDDAAPPADASVDTATVDAPPVDSGPLVTPIEEAAPPSFAPCPSGWRTTAHPTLGLDVCEPWPASGRATCAAHEIHLPGSAGCQRVGSACPSDGWPASLPPGEVLFVRAGAAAGGDGSRAAPFGTVSEALDAAAGGTTLALAVGDYDEGVVVSGLHSIVGACAEGVVLHRTDSAGGLPIIEVSREASVDLRDVTLRSDRDDLFHATQANVTIRSVVFDGVGLSQYGGEASVEDARFAGPVSAALSAVSISSVDVAHVSRLVVTDSDANGVTILGDEVTVSDVAVAHAQSVGFQVTAAVSATIERVVVEDVMDLGVSLDGPMTVADLLVRRVVRSEMGVAGGLGTVGDVTLSRVRVEDAGDVAASMVEGMVEVDDLVIFGGREGGGYERGLELGGAAQIAMNRAVLGSLHDIAFLVFDEGTAVELSDVRVEDVASGPGGRFGRCLHAQQGSSVTAIRTRFTRCREAAVTASYGARVQLRDAVVEHILPLDCATAGCPDAQAGIGFVALEGEGAIDVERFSVSDVALAAVQVIEGGGIDLRDGTIRDNPVGINIQVDGYDLARLMDRVVFENNGLNLDTAELPVPAASAGP